MATGREDEIRIGKVYEDQHADALKEKPSESEDKLRRIEAEIRDIQELLRGSPSSKYWQEFKIKLDVLQSTRKYHLWHMYGEASYPRVPGQSTSVPPINLRQQIPDL